MGGRRIECARGKVVGGSSSTNAMAYVRGHRGDYDRWAKYGLPQWSYAHVLPYFRRQEAWEGGPDAWRGGDGPLTTRFGRYPDPIGEEWRSICRDCIGGIASLVELLRGRFSNGVMERLCRQEQGLFPRTSEVKFSCNCPDHASTVQSLTPACRISAGSCW